MRTCGEEFNVIVHMHYNSRPLSLQFCYPFSMSAVRNPPAREVRPGVQHVTVDAGHAGQRLDNFLLGLLKGVPRTRVYRLLRKGEVRVNRGRSRADYRLEMGDVVRIPPVRRGESASREVAARAVAGGRFDWLDDRVLYEDEHLLVLDKPAGLAVHGGSQVNVGLIEALRELRPQNPFLELAHRLDRDTSGCLMVAKSRPALTRLHDTLRAGELEKYYLALVAGRWRGGMRTVEAALERGRQAASGRRVEVGDQGKAAASVFRPREKFPETTLVEIRLLTGRTHQARVHAAHIGHAIAGDDKYGDADFNRTVRRLGLRRLFLHAARLDLHHPVTGRALRVSAPLPAELEQLLEKLRARPEAFPP
jgi:23S rRNA pseudouridine955/2504/2580 synthase